MGGIRLGSGLDTECVIVVVRLLWPGGVLGSLWGSMHLTRRARVQMKDCSNFFPFLRARANDSELTASLFLYEALLADTGLAKGGAFYH